MGVDGDATSQRSEIWIDLGVKNTSSFTKKSTPCETMVDVRDETIELGPFWKGVFNNILYIYRGLLKNSSLTWNKASYLDDSPDPKHHPSEGEQGSVVVCPDK